VPSYPEGKLLARHEHARARLDSVSVRPTTLQYFAVTGRNSSDAVLGNDPPAFSSC